MEQWDWIPGWEGWYRISSLGRVMSVGSVRPSAAKPDRLIAYQKRILKLQKGGSGYPFVCPSRHGKAKPMGVHRIVLTVFDRPCPARHIAHHKDGNKWNSNITNLEWVPRSQHLRKHKEVFQGEKNGMAKLTAGIVVMIRDVAALHYYTQKEIGLMFGISRRHIRQIVTRVRWEHVP